MEKDQPVEESPGVEVREWEAEEAWGQGVSVYARSAVKSRPTGQVSHALQCSARSAVRK